ncbi:hypothetical protein NP570_24490, partial [Vibrio parahaemolyticus]|nr:hypothetical protein [Vibrio parahaemolyticus]
KLVVFHQILPIQLLSLLLRQILADENAVIAFSQIQRGIENEKGKPTRTSNEYYRVYRVLLI